MKKALKGTLAIAAGVAVLGGVIAPSQASAWGPVRQFYTSDEITASTWGNKIVLNSITDSKTGDERTFLSARVNDGTDATWDTVWNGSDITVKDGQEYWIRLYFHNNNPNGWNGVAENVRAQLSIPNVSAKQIKVSGFLSASNATPNRYWDYVNFNSDQTFHLEYVYGSTVLVNKALGTDPNGYPLSDDYYNTKDGVLLGYDKLDGRLPGCYTYSGFVMARVKAVFDTDYSIEKKVRLEGEKEWKENVDAKVGDKVQFLIEYDNTSKDDVHRDVMIKDILPKNLRYVPGSTKLYNDTYDGATVNEDNIVTTGINIGHYAAGSNGLVVFTAEVIDNSLACGANTLVNWAQAGVGQKTIQDYATVSTTKVCTETEIPKTGPEALAGGAVAAGSVVTAAGYFVASRRSLRK